MGDDEGDGLGMLFLDEAGNLRRIRLLEELEGHFLQTALKAVEDLEGALGSEGTFEQVLGEFDAALGDETLGHRHLVKLVEDIGLEVGIDRADAGKVERELLDLFFGEGGKHLARGLGPQTSD